MTLTCRTTLRTGCMFLAFLALSGIAAAAQDVIALKIDSLNDVDGLDLKGLEGQIEVLTLAGGVTNAQSPIGSGGGSGKAVFSPYTIVKRIDSVSTNLFTAAASGTHFSKATISFYHVVKGTPATVAYFQIQLQEVVVTSQQINGSEAHPGRLDTESVMLDFSKVCLVDQPLDDTGAKTGPALTACWDRSKNIGS